MSPFHEMCENVQIYISLAAKLFYEILMENLMEIEQIYRNIYISMT